LPAKNKIFDQVPENLLMGVPFFLIIDVIGIRDASGKQVEEHRKCDAILSRIGGALFSR
jgi:hypothetical protein